VPPFDHAAPLPPGRAALPGAASALLAQWVELGEIERRAFIAMTEEVTASSRLIEDSTVTLSAQFRHLAEAAESQTARVERVAAIARMIEVEGRPMPLAEATAINFVSPAFITVLSVIFLAEKVGWRRWSAIAVGLVGVLIVVRPGSGVFQAAALLPLLTAAFWAGAVIATRKMAGAGGDPPETTLIWSAGVGFLLFTVLLPFGWQTPDAGQVGFGMLVGLVSSIPHALVVLAYRAAPASVLAPFSYVQLVTSSLVGFIGFGAVPDSWTFAGGAVIAAAGLYTAHRERVRAREARRIS